MTNHHFSGAKMLLSGWVIRRALENVHFVEFVFCTFFHAGFLSHGMQTWLAHTAWQTCQTFFGDNGISGPYRGAFLDLGFHDHPRAKGHFMKSRVQTYPKPNSFGNFWAILIKCFHQKSLTVYFQGVWRGERTITPQKLTW